MNQRWNMSGPVRFNANRNKCLDLPGASNAILRFLQLWDCNGWITQQWDYYWK